MWYLAGIAAGLTLCVWLDRYRRKAADHGAVSTQWLQEHHYERKP